MKPSRTVNKCSAQLLNNLLWFEPFYLALLAPLLLLPNKIVPLVLHPYVLLLLFPFWLLRRRCFCMYTTLACLWHCSVYVNLTPLNSFTFTLAYSLDVDLVTNHYMGFCGSSTILRFYWLLTAWGNAICRADQLASCAATTASTCPRLGKSNSVCSNFPSTTCFVLCRSKPFLGLQKQSTRMY